MPPVESPAASPVPGDRAAPSPAPRGWKGGFRQSMSWLHTWVGLVLGVVLYFMFVTGTAGYFNQEITRWMQAAPLASGPARSQAELVEAGLALIDARDPTAEEWWVDLPVETDRGAAPYVAWGNPLGEEDWWEQAMDPATLAAPAGGAGGSGARATGGGTALYVMHYALNYLGWAWDGRLATYIVGVATMFMLVAIVTGVVVHKKILVDFFLFRPGKGQRSWLDAHNLSSVLALPFLAMITYSGLIFYAYDYMPAVTDLTYGRDGGVDRFYEELYPAPAGLEAPEPAGVPADMAPAATILAQADAIWGPGQVLYYYVTAPKDANARVELYRALDEGGQVYGPASGGEETLWFDGVTGELLTPAGATALVPPSRAFNDVMTSLHEGRFAGPLLRWLYFGSGLLGAGMVATGLVLWTRKRRQQMRGDEAAHLGLRFVERFNVGIVAGLPVAVAAYFLANRLIPAGMEGRAEWELHALFIAWGLCLLHGAVAPEGRAWRDQLWLAAAAYAAVPVANLLTTEVHLGRSLPAGDWVLAGFDLTMLAFAAAFAAAARAAGRRAEAPAPRPRRAALAEGGGAKGAAAEAVAAE